MKEQLMKGKTVSQSIMKRLLLFVSMIMCIAVLAGCGSTEPGGTAKQAEYPKELHLTYVKSPLNIPSIIEKTDGIMEQAFKDKQMAVTYAPITEGPKQTEAIASGDIDIATVLGGTSAILAKANGVDLRIIGMYTRAPKAFVIVSKNPDIQTVADLRGKKIMGPKGTVLNQLLLSALDRAGMTADDVEYINGGIPQAMSAMSHGDVDAAMVAGPVALKAVQQGAHVVVSGEGYLDGSIVIAVSGKFADAYPDLVKLYMDTHNKTVQAYTANPSSYYAKVAQETGLTADDVATMAPWYNFNTEITDEDIKGLEASQEFLIKIGMIQPDKKVDIRSMIAK